MKRVIVAGWMLLSPFLVCDPQANVAHYNVQGLPAQISGEKIVADGTGEYGFKLDLASLPVGDYRLKAQACNVWGCSGWTEELFLPRPADLSVPVMLRLGE